jgi:methylenetetrahydrofolate--tRNA-(uracil-5-)-methyltransferase
MNSKPDLVVVGGGLAGCEAAWQAAKRGLTVHLYEMRPEKMTGAHVGGELAELVCSNSLGSNLPDRASGLLKEELRRLDSLLIQVADRTALPAGSALAVDRSEFSREITESLLSNANIRIIRKEVRALPEEMAVIASGPLTSPALSKAIEIFVGSDHLYFYDAISPIISLESIDFSVAYRASRYDRSETGTGDYINCPLSHEQYDSFVYALRTAERILIKEFESDITSGVRAGYHRFFEGCLPVEILAERSERTLAFGPLRPVGLVNPKSGKRPDAVVQLRQDNLAGTLYNLVGFQTNLTFPEQRRVFRMIPGLEQAEFIRYGQMHRNTYIYSPEHLFPTLQSRQRGDLFFAGQITGVEGYVGNIATGLLAGLNAARLHHNQDAITLPQTTMTGALCRYISQSNPIDFQPMKANFGILPPLGLPLKGKRERAASLSQRALDDLEPYQGL